MSIIDKIMGRNNNDLSKVFANEKTSISAATAYQKSRFGMVKTDKELLEEFFIDIKDLIDQKNLCRKYCGMVEVNTDIIRFLPKIIDRLSRELGYKVIVLDDNCEITNKITGNVDTLKCDSTFIILIWNKQAIEDVSAINAALNTDNVPAEVVNPDNLDTIDITENPLELKGPNENKEKLKSLND